MSHHTLPETLTYEAVPKGAYFQTENGNLFTKMGSQIARSPSGDLVAFAPDCYVMLPVAVKFHLERADGKVEILDAKVLMDRIDEGSCCDLLVFDPSAPTSPVVYRRIWSRSSPRPTQYPFWQEPEVTTDTP